MAKKRCKKGKTRRGSQSGYCRKIKGVTKKKTTRSGGKALSETAFNTQKQKILSNTTGTSALFLQRKAMWSNLSYATYKRQFHMLHGGGVPVSQLQNCTNGAGKAGWRIGADGSCYDQTGSIGKRMNTRYSAYQKMLAKRKSTIRITGAPGAGGYSAAEMAKINAAMQSSIGGSYIGSTAAPVGVPRPVVAKPDLAYYQGLD